MISVEQSHADRSGKVLRDALATRQASAEGGAYAMLLEPGPTVPGPLTGVPVAIKDLIDIAGAPTRAGSRSRHDTPAATEDAPIVAALRRAGATLTGKTILDEFAFGITGVNEHEGTPAHHLDGARVVGGSSSGSALAVAEGSAAASLGTDTGGSVRIPAALCGLVGVKPSYGALSVAGVFPLSPTLDHVGVLAPDIESARSVLRVVAPSIEWSGKAPRRIGVDRQAFVDADGTVGRRVEQALSRLDDLTLREVAMPDPELVFAISFSIVWSEAAAFHHRTLRDRSADLEQDVRERLVLGSTTSARTYLAARRERRNLRASLVRLLDEFDAIIGPTSPIVAPTREEAADPVVRGLLGRNPRLANIVGLPAVSVPVPGDGLPVGLQVLARTDGAALSAAERILGYLR